MSDERAGLVLGMLRAIRAEAGIAARKTGRDHSPLGALKREVASLHLRVGEVKVDFANLSVRLDNLGRRVGRIELRLQLVEVPAS